MNSKEIFIEYMDKKILFNNQNYPILKKKIFKDNKILIFKNAIEVNFIKNIIQKTKKLMIKPKFKKAYLDCSNIYIYNKYFGILCKIFYFNIFNSLRFTRHHAVICVCPAHP